MFLGILSLGPGAPGSQYYPFDSIRFKSPSVGNFAEAQLEDYGMTLRTNKYDRKAGSSIYGAQRRVPHINAKKIEGLLSNEFWN